MAHWPVYEMARFLQWPLKRRTLPAAILKLWRWALKCFGAITLEVSSIASYKLGRVFRWNAIKNRQRYTRVRACRYVFFFLQIVNKKKLFFFALFNRIKIVADKDLIMWKLFSLFIGFAVVCAEQKVPVSVYYESLCPDSIAMLTQQVIPAHNTQLKNYMDLQFIPYGRAKHSRSPDGQKWEFECHHGMLECYANKIHGCILKEIPNEDTQLKYIDCLMKQSKGKRNEYPLTGCISAQDTVTVTNCANGTKGEDYLAAYGDETARLNPPLSSVPTVVFNQAYKKSDQDLAATDFKKVLCSYLKNECPSECNSAAIISLSSSAAAILFFMVFRYL